MTNRIVLTAFAILGIAGTAAAAPIELPGNTPLYSHFNNIEQVNAANNLVVPGYAPAAAFGDGLQGNWGLFNIDDVRTGAALPFPPHNDIAGGGSLVFQNDGAGGSVGQISGIFYGLDFTSATTATGGVLDIYWHDAGSDTIDANCMAGITCLPDAATVARFTTGNGGILLARLKFDFGIIPGDGVTTLQSTSNPTTQGGSGQADAFANVDLTVAGLWRDVLNGDWFFVDGPDAGSTRGDGPNELRDVRFSTFFNADLTTWNGPAGSGTVGLRSNDPVRVFTQAVPEPATLTLLGLGLAGLARRRQKKA